MSNMKHTLILILSIFIFSGCAVSYKNVDLKTNSKLDNKMKILSLDIQSLSNNIDETEANRVAYDAITYSKHLANEYQIVAPALFHNSLVNMNIKEKGFCYHYANDLLKYLKTKKYKSFKFIRAVANRSEYFEHSSILLTTNDIDFENSLVLDAWRNTGELFWSKVKNDKRYKWERK